MTERECLALAKDTAYLTACAVNSAAPEEARLAAMDTERVRAFAARHLLSAAVAAALHAAGRRDASTERTLAEAMRRAAIFDRAFRAIRAALDEAGIWYTPLKGVVLQDLYPARGMRQMADHDVLIDPARAGDVRRVMESLGYTTESFGSGSHDVYHKPPMLNFEMHRELFGTLHDPRLCAYYREVADRLVPGEGRERRFTPEDFYVYMIAHEYKHFSGGGTGLRSLLDVYVYLRHSGGELDMACIAAETEKLGLRDFERENRDLALRLFDGEALSASEEELLLYFAASGVYGTLDRRVGNRVERLGGGARGKGRYLLRRLFLPLEEVKAYYPFFYRHRALLPALALYRLGKIVRRWSSIRAELRALRQKT